MVARADTNTTEMSAGEILSRVTVQAHVLVANVGTPDDPTALAEQRFLNYLSARSDVGRWNFGLDATSMLTQYQNTGPDHPVALEKKHISYLGDNLRIDLGDSTQQLGRGIALDLYRDDVFGIYTTLEGGSARYDGPNWKGTGFAGRINTLVAPVSIITSDHPLQDGNIILGGGALEFRPFEGSKLGAHAFMAQQNPFDGSITKNWNTVGLVVAQENIVEGVDFYLEPNVLTSTQQLDNTTYSDPMAFGTFASLTANLDQWKFKLEAKDYRNYAFYFRRAPTLEDSIVAALNVQDITAARFQTERKLGNHTLIASVLTGYDREVNTRVHHGIAVGRFHWGQDELEFKAGYRTLPGDSDMKHAGFKFKVPSFSGQSVEMNVRRQMENKNGRTLPTQEDRNILEATYNLSERWSIGVGYENMPLNTPDLGTAFFNSNLAYKAGAKSARAFVGSTSGGTRCSGGVCRIVPPFSGAMVEGYYTF